MHSFVNIRCWVSTSVVCLTSVVSGQSFQVGESSLVANYVYTCNTETAGGEKTTLSYGLNLLIGENVACSLGQLTHEGKQNQSDLQNYVPITWQNYPEGKITSQEIVPLNYYLTTEENAAINWQPMNEFEMILGKRCQKAVGLYGGREWTAWFAEGIPTKFGPWRLQGLPGLILKVKSSDGIHLFECKNIELKIEPIVFSPDGKAIKCSREKFVKLRNRIFTNPTYVVDYDYYISKSDMSDFIYMRQDYSMIKGMIVNSKPLVYKPLDF